MEPKKYLTHVNALRGLAILLVFLYHLCPSVCPKGYYGVDIFFVLSGYFLIQSTWDKIQLEVFNLKSYVTGKIARIYPSLLSVILFALIVTCFLFSGSEFNKVLETAKTALLGYSNVYIDSISSNYFMTALDEQPLLHTWYLSVTLQAYLLFPLLLMLVACIPYARYRKSALITLLAILGLTSLGIFYWDYIQYGAHKIWGTYWNTSNPHPYYWTSGRLWEFIAGAFIPYLPEIKQRWVKEALVILSLFAIVFLCYATALPALCGIVAVVATMFIVRYTTGTGISGKSLSLPILLWLGSISFSLYLWHLPIISIMNYIALTVTSHIAWWAYALTGILCLIISMAAYRWIEHKMPPGRNITWFYSSAFSIMILIGFTWPHLPCYQATDQSNEYREWVYETDPGIVKQFPDNLKAMRGFYGQYPVNEGYQPPAEKGNFVPAAHIGLRQIAPNFVLIGDSHANHLFPALDKFAKEEGYSGVYVSRYVTPFTGLDFCTRHFEFNPHDYHTLMSWLQSHPELETVIIGQRWHIRFNATLDTQGTWHPQSEQPSLSGTALAQFCKELKHMGKRVIVIGPLPECPHAQPAKYIQRCHRLGLPISNERLITPIKRFENQSGAIIKIMQEHEQQGLYDVIYPHKELFSQAIFNARHGNTAVFSDSQHLNLVGAELVVNIIKPQLMQRLKKSSSTTSKAESSSCEPSQH